MMRAGCDAARTSACDRLLDYDSTSSDGTLKGDDLGECEATLSDILKGDHHGVKLVLAGKGAKPGATLHVMWEDASSPLRGTLTLTLKGTNLANRDGMFGTSDPFWVLSKRRKDGVYVPVAKSGAAARDGVRVHVRQQPSHARSVSRRAEKVMNNLNPVWKPVDIDLQHLCNGDMKRELKLEVMHWEKDDKSIEIGHQDRGVTAEAISSANHVFALLHPTKGDSKAVGNVAVVNAQLKTQHTFDGYVAGGLEVDLIAGIDFTGSNGDAASPSSLHYNAPGAGMTQYQVAINAISKVLAPYDSDGKIKMFGFGAQPKRGDRVSHCFSMTYNENDASVAGLPGMNAAYTAVVKQSEFSGPTNAAPVIRKATELAAAAARQTNGPLHYSMLLLLSDGELDDFPDTQRAIADAASVPLSIFVVGIGSCSFDKLKALDTGDAGSVLFLRMADYGAGAAARLANKVMQHLPSAVERFFTKAGIAPGKK